ncbi:MAG TPA: DUF3084 domain-containing protein, partial [Candidatus Caenarcaniphilales bacterium]
LGGTIATVGDRLGSRVGKARLRLFNLRPRKTAVVVTAITGSTISFLTLTILFTASEQLRDGVFRIESIQKQRRQAEAELAVAQVQTNQIRGNLAAANAELTTAQRRLQRVNLSLNKAIARQNKTQAQLNQVQAKFHLAQADLQRFSRQARQLSSEIHRLETEARQLQVERQRLTGQRNQAQALLRQAEVEQRQLEQLVTQAQVNLKAVKQQRDQLERSGKQAVLQAAQAQANLRAAQSQKNELLKQQAELQAGITALEASRRDLKRDVDLLLLGLRRGNIAIRSRQVLASSVVQNITTPTAARQKLEQLQQEATRAAIELTQPAQLKTRQLLVQIANAEEVIQEIDDGQVYAVRLLAVVNYLVGESRVVVFADAVPNKVVFPAGEQVATVEVNPTVMSDDQILERLDYLFSVSNRRAVQSGILRDPLTGTVGSFRQADLLKFILQLKRYEGSIKVVALTPETVYTSGPLKLELVAFQGQQIIFRSG